MSPVANSIKQTVLNSHDKAKIQRKTKMCGFFFKKIKEIKNWFLQREFTSEEKFQCFAFMFHFFSSPPSLFFFVFCQKQLGLTLQAVTSRPSPASYKGENSAVGWSRKALADIQPSFTHMRCKDWGKKGAFSIWTRVCALRTNPLWHSEGSFPCNNWTNRYGWNARGTRRSKFYRFQLFKKNVQILSP